MVVGVRFVFRGVGFSDCTALRAHPYRSSWAVLSTFLDASIHSCSLVHGASSTLSGRSCFSEEVSKLHSKRELLLRLETNLTQPGA